MKRALVIWADCGDETCAPCENHTDDWEGDPVCDVFRMHLLPNFDGELVRCAACRAAESPALRQAGHMRRSHEV